MNSIPQQENKNISYSFKKEERLCSKNHFDKLFAEGKSFLVYPLKVVFIEIEFQENYPAKAAFAVSKRNFKNAVARNRLKRKMREAYRLNKHLLYAEIAGKKLALAFVYIAKEDLPYKQIANAVIKGIKIIPEKLKKA